MPTTRRWLKAALAATETPALPWTRGKRRRPAALHNPPAAGATAPKSGARAAR